MEKIIMIQKMYKIRRIKKILNLVNMKNLDNEFGKLDYNRMINKLQDTQLMRKISILLYAIHRYANNDIKYNKNMTKYLLSAYAIKYNMRNLLTTLDDKQYEMLYSETNNVINYMNNIMERLDDNIFMNNMRMNIFCILFNSYYVVYNILLEVDRNNIIGEACSYYKELRQTKRQVLESTKYGADQKLSVLAQLDIDITDTKNKILELDANFNMKQIEYINNVENEIRDRLTDEYWCNMALKIEQEDYTDMINAINEIKMIITSFYASEKQNEVSDRMNKHIDTQEIYTKLQNKTMTKEDVITMTQYMYDSVFTLQAPIHDKEMNDKNMDMTTEYNNNNVSTCEYITMMIRMLYKIIHNVYTDMNLMKYMR